MKKIFSHSYPQYSYDFYLDTQFPERELVTCVFCVLRDEQGNIWLTKNHRGRELPGGHIEPGEDYEEALIREIKEEIGVACTDLSFVGYKKIRNFERIPNRNGGFYPFPHSYIVFFTGTAVGEKMQNFPSGEDETEDSGLFTIEEAGRIINKKNNRKIMEAIIAQM